jgi:hypothetical protein
LVSLRELLSGFVQQMGGTGPALLSSCRFPSRLAAWGRVCWFGLLAWVFGLGSRPRFSVWVRGVGSWRGFLAWILGVDSWCGFLVWILGVDSWCGGGLVFFPGFFGRLLPADWWCFSLFSGRGDARARGSALHRGLGFIKVDFVPVNAVELGESSGDLCGVSPFQAVAPRSA